MTDSRPSLEKVTMSPHTVATSIPISRRLLLQSTPDVENVVRRDITARIAGAIDLAALNGDGANALAGLRSRLDATALNWATLGKPTFAEMVALETAVAAANADLGALAYMFGAPMSGALKSTVIEAGTPTFVEGEVDGHPRVVSNQAQAGDMFFGNFADGIVGF